MLWHAYGGCSLKAPWIQFVEPPELSAWPEGVHLRPCPSVVSLRMATNSLGKREKGACRPLWMFLSTNSFLSAPRPGLHPMVGGFTQGHILPGFPIHKSIPGLSWTPPGKEPQSPEGQVTLLLHAARHARSHCPLTSLGDDVSTRHRSGWLRGSNEWKYEKCLWRRPALSGPQINARSYDRYLKWSQEFRLHLKTVRPRVHASLLKHLREIVSVRMQKSVVFWILRTELSSDVSGGC